MQWELRIHTALQEGLSFVYYQTHKSLDFFSVFVSSHNIYNWILILLFLIIQTNSVCPENLRWVNITFCVICD